MASLKERIEAEKENVEKVLKELKHVMKKEKKTTVELAAIATFLHNTYNGIENILKQTLKAKNITTPKSDTWHKDLLKTSVQNNIITRNLADKLLEYTAFRHFFIHGYGFMLEEQSLKQLANNIPNI